MQLQLLDDADKCVTNDPLTALLYLLMHEHDVRPATLEDAMKTSLSLPIEIEVRALGFLAHNLSLAYREKTVGGANDGKREKTGRPAEKAKAEDNTFIPQKRAKEHTLKQWAYHGAKFDCWVPPDFDREVDSSIIVFKKTKVLTVKHSEEKTSLKLSLQPDKDGLPAYVSYFPGWRVVNPVAPKKGAVGDVSIQWGILERDGLADFIPLPEEIF